MGRITGLATCELQPASAGGCCVLHYTGQPRDMRRLVALSPNKRYQRWAENRDIVGFHRSVRACDQSEARIESHRGLSREKGRV